MIYYKAEQASTLAGIYKGYEDGYYLFELNNGVIMDFEQINKKVLEEFDLKSTTFKNKSFIVNYLEIIDDLDDEDFIIYKIEKLELL